MGSLGDNYQDAALDALLGSGFTKPTTVWVSLYTFAPSAIGGGTEVSGGSYSRVSLTNNATNWPNAFAGSKSNGAAVTFPTATSSWGTLVAFGIHDNATADSLIMWGMLSIASAILAGDTASFDVGALSMSAS